MKLKACHDKVGKHVTNCNNLEMFDITGFELSKILYTCGLFGKIELTAGSKLVLWALCSYYNPVKRTMFPSQATLARQLGVSEKTVERAVKELRESGLIVYETRGVNHYGFCAKFWFMTGVRPSLESGAGAEGFRRAAFSEKDGAKIEKNADVLNERKNARGGFSGRALDEKKRGALAAEAEDAALGPEGELPAGVSAGVKMSGGCRQNVGSGHRQNVGQTNKAEKKEKGVSFSEFKGAEVEMSRRGDSTDERGAKKGNKVRSCAGFGALEAESKGFGGEADLENAGNAEGFRGAKRREAEVSSVAVCKGARVDLKGGGVNNGTEGGDEVDLKAKGARSSSEKSSGASGGGLNSENGADRGLTGRKKVYAALPLSGKGFSDRGAGGAQRRFSEGYGGEKRTTPSVEQTRGVFRELHEAQKAHKEAVLPKDYSKERAYEWIKGLDPRTRRALKSVRELCEKWGFEEFEL